MRLTPRHLTFKALCVLDETLHGGPGGPGLRFALEYLYAVGNGEPWLFRDFWEAANRPERLDNDAGGFGCKQMMTGALNGIARSVGMERDLDLIKAMRAEREKAAARE